MSVFLPIYAENFHSISSTSVLSTVEELWRVLSHKYVILKQLILRHAEAAFLY